MQPSPVISMLCGAAAVVVSYLCDIDSRSTAVVVVLIVALAAWMTEKDLMGMAVAVACMIASSVAEWLTDKDVALFVAMGVLTLCMVGIAAEGGVRAVPVFSWVHICTVACLGLSKIIVVFVVIALGIAAVGFATGREMRIAAIGSALGMGTFCYVTGCEYSVVSVINSLAILAGGYLVSSKERVEHLDRALDAQLDEIMTAFIALVVPIFKLFGLSMTADHDLNEEDIFLHDQNVRKQKKVSTAIKAETSRDTRELIDELELEPQLGSQPIIVSDAPTKVSMTIYLGKLDFREISERRVIKIYPDVVCIIDVSGSMAELNKLDYVKRTLISLIDFMQAGRLAIVIFSTDAQVLVPFTEVSDSNRNSIKKKVQSIEPDDQTNIVAGVKLAQKLIKGLKIKHNSIVSMLLLSDGQHNQGLINNEILFANDLQTTGIEYTLHTFGYGHNHDPAQMQTISETKHGNYYYVRDVAKVEECFTHCLAAVITTVAGSARLTLRLTPSAALPVLKIKKMYGPHWHKISDIEAVMEIGSISEGFSKDFGLEVYIDAKDSDLHKAARHELATFTLEYTEIATGKFASVNRTLTTLLYPKGSSVQVFTNSAAKSKMLRATGADLIKKALELHKGRRTADAIDLLRSFKADFDSSSARPSDVVLESMLREFGIMIVMMDNEMKGRRNEDNTMSYMTQQMNIYANQISVPHFGDVY